MQLFAQQIDHQFQRNHEQHVFAEELKIKIQKLRECFTGNSLPAPTGKMAAAWHNVPNGTRNVLPMCMKLNSVCLRAPPPTPTGFEYDLNDTASSDSSLKNNRDPDNSWVLVDKVDTPPPTPMLEVVAPRPTSAYIASDFIAAWCTTTDECPDKQNLEEDQRHSTTQDSPSSSSDPESLSSGDHSPFASIGFHQAVDQWFAEYLARQKDGFASLIISMGIHSRETASFAARVARAIIKRVSRMSYTEGKDLENDIRVKALTLFRAYWQLDDPWRREPPSLGRSNNVASLMGSLFDAKICSSRDINFCLIYLLQGMRSFERLCAMHALLVQANDKLCKNRNLPVLTYFKESITLRDVRTGDYIWATTPHAKRVLHDILATIEGWMASQTLKREQPRTSSGNRTIRKSAVGPRLRNGPRIAEPPLLSASGWYL